MNKSEYEAFSAEDAKVVLPAVTANQFGGENRTLASGYDTDRNSSSMPGHTAITPEPLPSCGCRKATHEHGTRGMYGYHRCRCTPCKNANAAYDRAASRHKPRRAMIDGALVRARMQVLSNAGMTRAEMAEMCGLKPSSLDYAVYGRNGRPPAKILASTLAALNAIRYQDILAIEPTPGRKLDGTVSRLQVQALYSQGWAAPAIAPHAGIKASAITNLLRGTGVSARAGAAIGDAYRQLHGTNPPQLTDRQRASSSSARNRALAHGWTADMAEDHEYATAA